MIKITPLISRDIIGRYSAGTRFVLDNFTQQVIPTKNSRKALTKLNKVGAMNAVRLQGGQELKTIAIA